MSEEFVFDINYDITEAEAKIRKLNALWKQSEIRVEEFKSKISETKSDIAALKEKQASLNEELKKARDIAGRRELFLDDLKSDVKSGKTTVDSKDMALLEKNAKSALNEVKKLETLQESLYNKIKDKEVQEKKYNVELIKEKSKLDEINQKAKKTANEYDKQKKSVGAISEKIKNANNPLEQFSKRVLGLAKRVFVFSLITKGLRAVREKIGEILSSDKAINSKIKIIRGNLSTIGTTIFQALNPYISWFLDKLIYATQVVSLIIATLFGKNVKQMSSLAKNSKATANNVKQIADEAQRATAAFDNIQMAPNSSDSDSGDISSGSDNTGIDMSGIEQLDESKFERLISFVSRIRDLFIELSPLLKWLWDNILSPFISFAADLVILGLEKIVAALKEFSDWCKGESDGISLTSSIILGFLAGLLFYFSTKNIISLIKKASVAIKKFGAEATTAQAGTSLWAVAISVLAAGIIYLGSNWNKLTGAQKGITILTALGVAAATAAIAIAAFHTSWSVGIAAAAIAGGLALLGLTFASLKVNQKSKTKNSAVGSDRFASDFAKTNNFKSSPLPALATGAVLPGGSPTLAYVNDQPAGKTFLEGSVENILAAFEKYKPSSKETNPNYTVTATGQLAPLIRLLGLEIRKENERSTVF